MIKNIVVIWLCCITQAFAQDIDTITPTLFNYYTEDYPPSNYLEDDKPVGAAVETLKLMWQDMGVPEQSITVASWARGYRATLHKPLTMLFSMSKTVDREKLFKWVGPIFTDTHVLIALNDFPHDIQSIDDSYQYTVAAVREDISDLKLRETGFPVENIFKVTKLDQAIQMVKSKRSDLMIMTRESLKQLTEQNGMHSRDFKIVWTVSVNQNYYAFNKATPDKIIQQFQQAFDNVKVEHLKILKKYRLNP